MESAESSRGSYVRFAEGLTMNVEEIAQRVGGEVAGDPQLQITGVAGLEFAGPNDLTFADSARAVERDCGHPQRMRVNSRRYCFARPHHDLGCQPKAGVYQCHRSDPASGACDSVHSCYGGDRGERLCGRRCGRLRSCGHRRKRDRRHENGIGRRRRDRPRRGHRFGYGATRQRAHLSGSAHRQSGGDSRRLP